MLNDLLIADSQNRATAVDGGFSLTVPEAPEGTAPISGQSYIVLTGCNTTVSDDTVAAGPAIVGTYFSGSCFPPLQTCHASQSRLMSRDHT